VLKTNLASATDAKQKSDIQSNIDQAESYFAELRSMQITLPTMTFDRSLVLYGKSRTIQILWLGNAHTNGDVWIYLPKEKILFCGDAMHTRTPYMADSYPSDWIQTLAAAEKLDFTQAMGGHGEIMQGKERFAMWRQYFRDLLDETAKARARGASLDDAQTIVAKILVDKYASKFDPNFPTSVTGNIAKAYEVAGAAKH
jgi:glyoxylase-like metal-dependent hydrolase (beta-lactamase superfamily II)